MQRPAVEPRPSSKGKDLVAMGEDGCGDGDDESEGERRARPPSPTTPTAALGARGRAAAIVGGAGVPICQAEKCTADLTEAKRYHRRHKVCEAHAKAVAAIVAGIRQRFCQQCSRFHELSEFDEAKRSCRRRLAGHNERRRKSLSVLQGDGSSLCMLADQDQQMQTSLPGNSGYKHFQIR